MHIEAWSISLANGFFMCVWVDVVAGLLAETNALGTGFAARAGCWSALTV